MRLIPPPLIIEFSACCSKKKIMTAACVTLWGSPWAPGGPTMAQKGAHGPEGGHGLHGAQMGTRTHKGPMGPMAHRTQWPQGRGPMAQKGAMVYTGPRWEPGPTRAPWGPWHTGPSGHRAHMGIKAQGLKAVLYFFLYFLRI